MKAVFNRALLQAHSTKRGLVWHLLNVLDWDGGLIRETESDARAARRPAFGASNGELAAPWDTQQSAMDSVCRDLEVFLSTAANTNLEPQARSLLEQARAFQRRVDQRSEAWCRVLEALEPLHPQPRLDAKEAHVKAAILRLLHELLGGGAAESPTKMNMAELSRFICEENERLGAESRAPCPRFAEVDEIDEWRKVHARVRQIFSVSKHA